MKSVNTHKHGLHLLALNAFLKCTCGHTFLWAVRTVTDFCVCVCVHQVAQTRVRLSSVSGWRRRSACIASPLATCCAASCSVAAKEGATCWTCWREERSCPRWVVLVLSQLRKISLGPRTCHVSRESGCRTESTLQIHNHSHPFPRCLMDSTSSAPIASLTCLSGAGGRTRYLVQAVLPQMNRKSKNKDITGAIPTVFDKQLDLWEDWCKILTARSRKVTQQNKIWEIIISWRRPMKSCLTTDWDLVPCYRWASFRLRKYWHIVQHVFLPKVYFSK